MLHFVRPGAVRNITASELAGVDAEEPFDVSYAHALFQFLLKSRMSGNGTKSQNIILFF
jgi:hypothetical protein